MIVESRVNTYVILLQIAKFPCIALHPEYLRGPASSWSFQQFVVHLLYFSQLSRWEMVSQFNFFWTSLVVEWIKICLPMQGTQVWSLVWEDLTCHGATKPESHNCTETHLPRAHALQQQRPPQWDTHILQRRVAPQSLQLEKAHQRNEDSGQSTINKI